MKSVQTFRNIQNHLRRDISTEPFLQFSDWKPYLYWYNGECDIEDIVTFYVFN